MKIKTKLVLWTLLICAIFFVGGFLFINQTQTILEQNIGKENTLFVSNKLDEMDRNIYVRIEEIQILSRELILLRNILESNQEFEQLSNIQEYIDQKDQEWINAPSEEITPFMQDILGNFASQELIEKMNFYEEKYGYLVFSEVFVTNKYGVNTAQTGRTSDYYQADENWWQKAEESGLYIEDVKYDESTNVFSINICVRVEGENGNFLGVIKAVLNIEDIIGLLNLVDHMGIHAEHESESFNLFTLDGLIIFSTYEYGFLDDISNEMDFYLTVIEEDQDSYFLLDDNSVVGEKLIVHAHSEGYNDFQGMGWTLVLEHATSEIFAPIVEQKNLIVIVTGIMIGVLLFIAFLVYRSISKPVSVLVNRVSNITDYSNLDQKIGTYAKDELGQLSRIFDRMIEKLKKTTTSIDKLNVEITKREKTEEEHTKILANYKERVKELNCLYEISKLDENSNGLLDKIMQETSNLLPPAWQYPTITCSQIIFNNQKFKTKNFKETQWKQHADIKVHGKKVGVVEVYYLKEKPASDEGPFLKEERHLIDAVAKSLGNIVERKEAEKAMNETFDALTVVNEKLGVVGQMTRHDARNKLGVITNYVYLARKSLAGDSKVLGYLDRIEQASKSAVELFEFSKLYEQLGVEELRLVDVGECVEKAGVLLSGAEGVVVVNECKGFVVLADSLLQQLFYNLMHNSLVHGGHVSRIRVGFVKDKSGLLLFYEDDGVGIPRAEKEKVFLKGYGKGTGLGLFMIVKMCGIYGWTIKEVGTPGEGVRFEFVIPAGVN